MYALVRKNQKRKSDSILELLGYEVKINKSGIIVYNQEMIDILIKNKIMPEFNKLIKQILVFIEEDNDPEGATYLLDELARLYSVYLNNYEKYLSSKEKDTFMKKMNVLANELKRISRTKKMAPTVKGRVR